MNHQDLQAFAGTDDIKVSAVQSYSLQVGSSISLSPVRRILAYFMLSISRACVSKNSIR